MEANTVLCSTCATNFDSSMERREHMRSAWHVYNVKRRVDALPAVPLEFYQNEVVGVSHREQDAVSSSPVKYGAPLGDAAGSLASTLSAEATTQSSSESDATAEDADEDQSDCLFCNQRFENLQENLDHMHQAHSFSVPNADELATDMDTFVTYLALVIESYHSCLYCGHEKHSKAAVQAHMLDKGHCQLDLSKDSEYLDFWNLESEVATHFSSAHAIPSTVNDFRLASGQIISNRHAGRGSVLNFPKRHSNPESCALALIPASSHRLSTSYSDLTPSSASDHKRRALARRDELGVVGLSDLQKRALAVTQRKAKTSEDRANNKARWALENMGNKVKQKHFKPDTPGRKNG
ncbi:hypothetical protein CKM354_000443800 [Cercospora kikuchii]|uniref:C2H2-type domain-containing protein n=1 Tax=Cercospora kikuchii TaxID=84275 RepID=A0A9P3CGU3_9PEZI|nr:uncharacterized protein CKM354_000443800 [Cercospora kikuchii]GIZ41122.1 hypothetical protein CKM354_000443800 [Cercospora kikuchii]